MHRSAVLAAALVLLTALPPALPAQAPPSLPPPPPAEAAAVSTVLDTFHTAAARADEEAYFALLAPNAVFLGTDATERWDKAAFRAFAHPYFAKGQGWTFTARDRHIDVSRDGHVAWFDELLDSASYGECRGTGVLEKGEGGWKIVQYHLTIPMPNDLAKEFVARIREAKKAPAPPRQR
jgi:ketosteroid isomerase-like protein